MEFLSWTYPIKQLCVQANSSLWLIIGLLFEEFKLERDIFLVYLNPTKFELMHILQHNSLTLGLMKVPLYS